jgi:crotonobetainyl-CoA:carnitine CoA-transferase CaiB-like acyl-CoA transferase
MRKCRWGNTRNISSPNKELNQVLSCYRILGLSNRKGFFCGKLLGDLGADVTKIEKPGGDGTAEIMKLVISRNIIGRDFIE